MASRRRETTEVMGILVYDDAIGVTEAAPTPAELSTVLAFVMLLLPARLWNGQRSIRILAFGRLGEPIKTFDQSAKMLYQSTLFCPRNTLKARK